MAPPGDLDGLSHAELKGLVVKQWEEMVELQRMVAALRDEIARLKGGPGRPNIKPSGMEQATEPKPPGSSGNQRRPSCVGGKHREDAIAYVSLATISSPWFRLDRGPIDAINLHQCEERVDVTGGPCARERLQRRPTASTL